MKRILFLGLIWAHTAAAADQACVRTFWDFVRHPTAPWCDKDKTRSAPAASHQTITGVVREAFAAAGYTYMQIDTKTDQIWAAASKQEISTGDVIEFEANQPYENFHSNSLNRTFEKLYLVNEVIVNGEHRGADAATLSDAVPLAAAKAAPKTAPTLVGNGHGRGPTLAEVIQQRIELNGKKITVTGTVIKTNDHIMGTNWIHIADQSLNGATQNVALTSAQSVKVGDVVTATGVLAANKNLGAGYFFPALIENATLNVLPKTQHAGGKKPHGPDHTIDSQGT